MIRKYLIQDGDNNVETKSVEYTTTGVSGSFTVTTSSNVSWAAVTSSNIATSGGSGGTYQGPYYYNGDGVTTSKTIRDSDITNDPTADYESGSLILMLNGQLLVRDVHYEENIDGFTFDLIDIGTTGLSSIPTSSDDLAVIFKPPLIGSGGSVTTGSSIYISKVYPEIENGFEITYENAASGIDLIIKVIYQ